MSRTYTLKKRAEQQAETRQRIVEATVELHTTLGPSKTTLSMIAERAGVQRHTLYAHFPQERDLHMACSGLHAERDPLPDAAPWRAIADRQQRLRTGLAAIYGWYERNPVLTANVLRDVDVLPLTKEIFELRFLPLIEAWHAVLGEGVSAKQRPLLNVALSFYTWRSLTQDSGLTMAAAVEQMVQAIECAEH